MIEIKGIDPKMIANNLEPFEPTHPGELLKDEIEYRGVSQKQLAADMGVSYTVLNDIVNCKRPVNTKFALLCEKALGIPAYMLLRLQTDYETRQIIFGKTCWRKKNRSGALTGACMSAKD